MFQANGLHCLFCIWGQAKGMDIEMMIVKKMTWIVATLLILAVTGGCGQPKATPEETALAFCNGVVKLDFTGAEKVGLSQKDQTQIAGVRRQTFQDTAAAILKAHEIVPFSDATNKLADALEKINRKIEFKTELVSKEQDRAVVKVSVRTIDGDTFVNEIASPALDSEDFRQKLPNEKADFLIQIFSRNIDKVTLVKEAKTFEMKLVLDKKTGYWGPADKDFMQPLIEAVNW